MLDWAPSTELDAGLRRAIAYFRGVAGVEPA